MLATPEDNTIPAEAPVGTATLREASVWVIIITSNSSSLRGREVVSDAVMTQLTVQLTRVRPLIHMLDLVC